MRFGSVCSGIEAASVAWVPLGWRAAWLAEIEPFPSAVLAHHYPDVPNLGDMTALPDRIASGEVEAPDVFCGGTPCQAFSVAGLRRSLDDARGNLSLVFCEIANAIDFSRAQAGQPPSVIVWENVPGVLSTKDNAFGCFLAGLAGEDGELVAPGGKWPNAGAVYGPQRAVAWRVFDAQYFGLAQRRRRVFVVASARDGFDSAAILFEFDGMRRDIAPRRETGQAVAHTTAPCLTGSGRGVARTGDTRGQDPVVAVMAHGQGGAEIASERSPTLTCNHEAPIVFHPTQEPISSTDVCHALGANANATAAVVTGSSGAVNGGKAGQGYPAIAVSIRGRDGGSTAEMGDEVGHCLRASSGGGDKPHVLVSVAPTLKRDCGKGYGDGEMDPGGIVMHAMQVRRLTPRECERLQGFPNIDETVRVEICFDLQKSVVDVAIKCRKSHSNASTAAESASQPTANTAAPPSSTSRADQEPLVALNVQQHSGGKSLELRSVQKLILSVSSVGEQNESPLHMQAESFAATLARIQQTLGLTTSIGRGVSHPNISLSLTAPLGSKSAETSGRETEGCASGVGGAASEVKFTISTHGHVTVNCNSPIATLLCSAMTATSGFTPNRTLPESFSLELTTRANYTAIPWRKKTAAQCPDGPRYKALGNSWAVPNVRWIGRRIALAISILESRGDA